MLDRKKHRQEIESLKADNRQKDMNRRTSERRGQAGLTSSSSDATRPSPSKLGWRSLLPRLTCVLIGLSALCWTSCASSRKATSSLQLTAYGLHETRDTVREQVMVAVHDTIREKKSMICHRQGMTGQAGHDRSAWAWKYRNL